jgi:hypothetical protein
MSKSIYLIAFLLTLMVFAGVFLLARDEDSKKIETIYDHLLDQQQTMIYINAVDNTAAGSCDRLIPLVRDQLNQVYTSYSDIEKFDMYGLRLESREYDRLKRQYLIASMNLYQTLQKYQNICDFNISPVLYFWPDNADCPTCATFVYQLEEIKKDCPNVRVFAFPSNPANFEPVTLLQDRYRITASPVLVMGKTVVSDIRDTAELKKILECT